MAVPSATHDQCAAGRGGGLVGLGAHRSLPVAGRAADGWSAGRVPVLRARAPDQSIMPTGRRRTGLGAVESGSRRVADAGVVGSLRTYRSLDVLAPGHTDKVGTAREYPWIN